MLTITWCFDPLGWYALELTGRSFIGADSSNWFPMSLIDSFRHHWGHDPCLHVFNESSKADGFCIDPQVIYMGNHTEAIQNQSQMNRFPCKLLGNQYPENQGMNRWDWLAALIPMCFTRGINHWESIIQSSKLILWINSNANFMETNEKGIKSSFFESRAVFWRLRLHRKPDLAASDPAKHSSGRSQPSKLRSRCRV